MHDPMNIAVGQIAVSHGFLSREAAFHCLNHATQKGMNFADVARMLGVLTDSKYQKLNWLSAQASQRSQQSQALSRPPVNPTHVSVSAPIPASQAPSGAPLRVPSNSSRPSINSSTLGGLPEPGDWVGNYQILRLLGKGGMGAVYAARQGQRDYALKMILALENPADEIRFEREAQAAAAVDRHPNVVSVHSYDRHGVTPYAVFDLVEGVGLDELLTTGEAQEKDWSLNIVMKSLEALIHIHESGIIHRDLKPANILIRHSDGEPLITDFGLAKQENAEKLTRTGEMLGTPAYMASEQMSGEVVTEAADVWAMGVILYELLTGYRPFPGQTLLEICNKVLLQDPIAPSKHVENFDPELEKVILKCLQRDLEHRYTSARELYEDLERYLRGEDVEAVLPTFDVVGASKRYWWATLAFVFALLFLGVGALIYVKATAGSDRIAKLESELSSVENLDRAIAMRIVQLSTGRVNTERIKELIPLDIQKEKVKELNKELGGDLERSAASDRIQRIKFLNKLFVLKRIQLPSELQKVDTEKRFEDSPLGALVRVSLAANSKEIPAENLQKQFQSLPVKFQSLLLPLIDQVAARQIVMAGKEKGDQIFSDLKSKHEELKVKNWELFGKTLNRELLALRTRSQKSKTNKTFSEVFPMMVERFRAVEGIDFSEIDEFQILENYRRELENDRPLKALESAFELKKKHYWNYVVNPSLEDSLNTTISTALLEKVDGQLKVCWVIKALELGLMVDNYSYYFKDLEQEENRSDSSKKSKLLKDKELRSLMRTLTKDGQRPWYLFAQRLRFLSRMTGENKKVKAESPEAFLKRCQRGVATLEKRVKVLKGYENDPRHSPTIQREIYGLIAETFFDLHLYRAMLRTLDEIPKRREPRYEDVRKEFKPLLTKQIGSYFEKCLQGSNDQLARVSDLRLALLRYDLSYEAVKPLLPAELSSVFENKSIIDGLTELENLVIPGKKPDQVPRLTPWQRRQRLFKIFVCRCRLDTARLNEKGRSVQARLRQRLNIMAQGNRPYRNAFEQMLVNLMGLGFFNYHLEVYDAYTTLDHPIFKGLKSSLGPRLDRIANLRYLGRCSDAMKAIDELIEEDLYTKKDLPYPALQKLQVQIGFLAQKMKDSGKHKMAVNFMSKRAGGRLDLFQRKLFFFNPYLIRWTIYSDVTLKDEKSLTEKVVRLTKRWLKFRNSGALGWNRRAVHDMEVRCMFNELPGHCESLKRYNPALQMLLTLDDDAFRELWPAYRYLMPRLKELPGWLQLKPRIDAMDDSFVRELAQALACQDFLAQSPLFGLLESNHDPKDFWFRKSLQTELMRCLDHYNRQRPVAYDKAVGLYRVVRASRYRDLLHDNYYGLNSVAFPLYIMKLDRELRAVVDLFFDRIRREFLNKNKVVPKFPMGRGVFILEWYIQLLSTIDAEREAIDLYNRIVMFHRDPKTLNSSERTFRTNILSRRYSTYHYGRCLLKLGRFDDFNKLLAEMKKGKGQVQYYRLRADLCVTQKNFDELLKINEEMKQRRFRHGPSLTTHFYGLYLVGTKRWEEYKRHKADTMKQADYRKYIPEWEELRAKIDDQ